VRRRLARGGAALVGLSLALMLMTPGCRPLRIGGLPAQPEQLFTELAALESPSQVHMVGRLRTEIGGVEMNLGMELLTDGRGNAKMELSYPFGGRAATLVLQEDQRLLAIASGERLVLYTPGAAELLQGWVGEWARPAMIVDLMLGRVPAGFQGEMAWDDDHGDQRMLAVALDGGHSALLSVQRRPQALQQLLLEDAGGAQIASASWDGWLEVEGYLYPTDIRLEMPDPVGSVALTIESIVIDPAVVSDTYQATPPRPGYMSFEELFEQWRE